MAPRKRTRASKSSSKRAEDTEEKCTSKMLKTDLAEDKKLIEKAYGVSLPNDFYMLWTFCSELDPQNPRNALSAIGFELVGPYEVLSRDLAVDKEGDINFHLHWRFYYDAPEFMTVIICTHPSDGMYHVGYIRDDPKDEKCVVACNGGDNWSVAVLGDNLFRAVQDRLDLMLRAVKVNNKPKINKFAKAFSSFIEAHGIEVNSEANVKVRDKKIVAPAFHGAGIVVPIDENEVGYRPVYETQQKLLKMYKKIDEAHDDDMRMKAFDPLQEIIGYVQLANDECDFGMGLELGMSMFCYGSKYLNKAASRTLSMAYSLLGRDLYKKIIECHIADRRKENFARFSSA